MTQTPTPPVIVTSYFHRIVWGITPGSINTIIPGPDNEDTEDQINYFPSTGVLPDTDITPDLQDGLDNDKDPYNIIQPKFTVTGKVQRVLIIDTTSENDNGEEETVRTYFFQDVPYRLNSMTITSRHESNNVWVFPDDFSGASVPEGTPKEYGGIVLQNAEPAPVNKQAGELSSCGSDGQSGYQYLDVFNDFDFKYIPRNSIRLDSPGIYEDKDVKDSRDRFPTKPRFPEVTDEDGLSAPIMPIDMITNYEGDERDSYTITYRIFFDATVDTSSIGLIPVGGIQNPLLTVTQTVTQDVENLGKQLQILLGITNFNFATSRGLSFAEMSPGYPIAYPYTVVSGFNGQPTGSEPTSRNTISGSSEGKLEKGDLWYNPSTKTRKYYQINSFVEGVEIKTPGTIYNGAPGPVNFPNLLQKNKSFMKGLDNIIENIDKYLEGDETSALRGLRGTSLTFEDESIKATEETPLEKRLALPTFPMKINNKGKYEMNMDSTGKGLKVDVEVNKDGGVERATVAEAGEGYKDGETVGIYGGDCILEVKVNSDEFWRDEFVDRLGIGKSQFLGGFSLEE